MASIYDASFSSDAEKFLSKNLIIPPGSLKVRGTDIKAVTGVFTLVASTRGSLQDSGRKVLDLDYVENGKLNSRFTEEGLGPDGIIAYFLPYESSRTKRMMLGARANYMFTAALSGCTFGYGSRATDGSTLVTHSNKMDQASDKGKELRAAVRISRGSNYQFSESELAEIREKELLYQSRLQRESASMELQWSGVNRNLKLYQPSDYNRSSHLFSCFHADMTQYRSTIIGVRHGVNWKFYSKKYRFIGNKQYIFDDVIEI